MLGSVELQQQHDENAVVRQLLELCLPHVVVLNQHPDHDAQHLQEPEGRGQDEATSGSGLKGVKVKAEGAIEVDLWVTLLRRLILVTVLVASPECLTSRAMSLTKASRLW